MGSFSDPEDSPGLAHSLEHMVFMGSEKFPSENGFDKFVNTNGGLHTGLRTIIIQQKGLFRKWLLSLFGQII